MMPQDYPIAEDFSVMSPNISSYGAICPIEQQQQQIKQEYESSSGQREPKLLHKSLAVLGLVFTLCSLFFLWISAFIGVYIYFTIVLALFVFSGMTLLPTIFLFVCSWKVHPNKGMVVTAMILASVDMITTIIAVALVINSMRQFMYLTDSEQELLNLTEDDAHKSDQMALSGLIVMFVALINMIVLGVHELKRYKACTAVKTVVTNTTYADQTFSLPEYPIDAFINDSNMDF